ncbi:Trm112 family protein [Coralloluteibacterium thermophilus]|uniref:Trm112 family protein n=1 Tax=Coralloluteibacterium thermophilum TaxID=2707049 RepID=A0ABV9NL05_9GAMM
MDRRLLDLLCCPETRQPLALMSGEELDALNRAIAAGQVQRSDGAPQTEGWREGLITADRRRAYRVDDGIPVLLAEEGIATAQVAGLA